MFSARRGVSGDDCMRAAFPADSPRGLTEALAALERAHPSAAVAVLVASLNPYHWRSSRSAVGGLREQGRAALRAAPAVAGWLKLSVDHGVAPLLVPPVRYWQRGIVGYLDALNGDLETVATALHGFAVALRERTWGSATNSDWDEYTHSETLALIGKLGPHLDRLRVERDWLASSAAEPPAEPPAADPPSLPEQSVAWAQQELAAPSVSRRLTACRLLRQLGSDAQPALPALRAMLAQLDGAAPAAVAELREEALMTLRDIEPAPQPAIALSVVGTPAPGAEADQAPAGDQVSVDQVSARAGDRLLALASEDADSSVRTAALHAIADAGAPIAGALAVALRAAAAEDRQERAAAARLLAMLVR